MYKTIILLWIIFLTFYIFSTHIKRIMLYQPSSPQIKKYDRFYKKILQLIESPNYFINTLVNTIDNEKLDTVHIINPDTSKCIIFFHGNNGNLSMRFDIIKFLYNYASIVIFDYRCYGKSSGNINNLCEKLLQIDADTIWNYTRNELKYKANDISLFGESLGCSLAVYLASKMSRNMDSINYPHSLILNAPFYSLSSMIEFIFSKINSKFVGKILAFFIGNEYKTNKCIQFINHKTKIAIAHSPRDEIIPYHQGWNLYQSISKIHTKNHFININGTHHNLGLTNEYVYTLADIYD